MTGSDVRLWDVRRVHRWQWLIVSVTRQLCMAASVLLVASLFSFSVRCTLSEYFESTLSIVPVRIADLGGLRSLVVELFEL